MVTSRAVSERDTDSAGHTAAAVCDEGEESGFAVFDGDGEAAVGVVGDVAFVGVEAGVEGSLDGRVVTPEEMDPVFGTLDVEGAMPADGSCVGSLGRGECHRVGLQSQNAFIQSEIAGLSDSDVCSLR